jgi:hypothetical protein
MNWEVVGVAAEIVGAIAVGVSLLYLAIQVKSQVTETRAAAIQETSEGFREGALPLLDPQVASIWVRGIEGIDELADASERIQFIAMVQTNFRIWENGFYQRQAGRLDSELWGAMERQYAAVYSTKGAQDIWALRRSFFGDEFQLYVEQVEPADYKI